MLNMKLHTHFQNVFGSMAPFIPPTKEHTGPCFEKNLQKHKCPKKMLDLSFLENEIMLIEKVPYDKYDGHTDPKVLFEEPVLHHFRSNTSATPVCMSCATIMISSSTRDTESDEEVLVSLLSMVMMMRIDAGKVLHNEIGTAEIHEIIQTSKFMQVLKLHVSLQTCSISCNFQNLHEIKQVFWNS
jgi:hypothetical protein